MKVEIKDELINQSAKSLIIQEHQKMNIDNQLYRIDKGIDILSEMSSKNDDDLDELILKAEELCNQKNIDISMIDIDNINLDLELNNDDLSCESKVKDLKLKYIDVVNIDKADSWDEYMESIEKYAKSNNIDLSGDPFEKLMTESEKAEFRKRITNDYKMKEAKCDKYDYMIAAFCGVVSGIIDSFFVGMPDESKLGNWTNDKTDKFVIKIAKLKGWNPKEGNENSINLAIKFLEGKYKVNYDQATGKAANSLLGMTMSNHHIKSLGHAPDIVGLIFSIVDQFTGQSHFLDNGRFITFDANKSNLYGKSFIAKLFCGFSNWLGHLISDIAGSSSSRSDNKDGYGSGIPMPFFELFQLCNIGSFNVYPNNDKGKVPTEMSLADLSVKIFENHYDSRFAMAQAVPVLINEIMIRLLWAIKSRFYNNKSWKECIPVGSHPELRRMLLTGHGVLCMIDSVDAAVKSNGQILLFALRLNFVAWKRLAFGGLMEVRAIYKDNSLDLNAMEDDLKKEWDILYGNSEIVF